MKFTWILSLLVVLSCGKNTSPKKLDLNDDDGDTIPNAQDALPFVTDYKDPDDVFGKIRFYVDSSLVEQDFSNTFNKNKRITDLLTKGNLASFKNLSEADKSVLSFSPVRLPTLTGNSYIVEIKTEASANQIESLQMIDGSAVKFQVDWSPYLRLELPSEDVVGLASGNIKLKMIMKSFHSQLTGLELEKNIEERTYKVLFQQGTSSKMFRVSKRFSFQEFLKFKNIQQVQPANQTDFLLASDSTTEQWWHRELAPHIHVIVYSSQEKLKKNFLQGFNSRELKSERENGIGQSSESFSTIRNGRVFFRINASSYWREFKTKVNWIETRDDYCKQVMTYIYRDYEVPVEKNDLINNLKIKTKNDILNLDQLGAEIYLKDHQWNISFKSPTERFELFVPDLPKNMDRMIQRQSNSCNITETSQRMSPEKNLTFAIESFVEKDN